MFQGTAESAWLGQLKTREQRSVIVFTRGTREYTCDAPWTCISTMPKLILNVDCGWGSLARVGGEDARCPYLVQRSSGVPVVQDLVSCVRLRAVLGYVNAVSRDAHVDLSASQVYLTVE